MKPSALILVLLVLVVGCKRQSEPATSSDGEMEHKLAGVWVHKLTLKSGSDIVSTLEMNPDGTFTEVHIFSKPLPDGLSRIETSGRWRIEDGYLIMTETSSSLTNAQLPEEARFRVVRVDGHELEYEPPEKAPDKVEEISIPTNHIIFKKQTR